MFIAQTLSETCFDDEAQLHRTQVNRTTSGVTEGINTRIKLIIRQSYGFKNFNLMKEKLLACLFK